MTLWTFLADQFHTNQFLNGAVITGCLLALVAPFRKLPKTIFRYLWGKVFTTVSVDSSSDIYWWLNKVIQNMPYDRHRRSHYLMGRILVRNPNDEAEDNPAVTEVESDSNTDDYNAGISNRRVLDCVFSPAEGGYWFRFKKKWMYLHFEIMKEGASSRQKPVYRLNIGYFGKKEGWIQELLQEAQIHLDTEINQKVLMYITGSYSWLKSNNLNAKSLSSVILKEGLMESIVQDFKNFQASENKYNNLGIPFHRTMLFEGPPGTGKTSTILALANELKLAVFYLNLVTVNSERLPSLIQEVQNCSLLVIEDLGGIYNQEETINKSALDVGPPQFSVLLNCLDGFLSKYGSLTVLTTNHPDRLSPLLNRPGRIDSRYYFGNADSGQVQRMCRRYYEYHSGWSNKERDSISQEIAARYKLLRWSLSPARIQQILLLDTCLTSEDSRKHFYAEAERNITGETV